MRIIVAILGGLGAAIFMGYPIFLAMQRVTETPSPETQLGWAVMLIIPPILVYYFIISALEVWEQRREFVKWKRERHEFRVRLVKSRGFKYEDGHVMEQLAVWRSKDRQTHVDLITGEVKDLII